MDRIWQFEAGFDAGARAIDPNIRIRPPTSPVRPTTLTGSSLRPPANKRRRRRPAAGADVIFAAAGTSGLGVLEAAVRPVGTRAPPWPIGVDSDQYVTVGDLPGTVASEAWRQHILTSIVKRYDAAVYEALAAYAEDGTTESVVLGLADHGIDLSYSGGFLDDVRDQIEALATTSSAEACTCRAAHLTARTSTPTNHRSVVTEMRLLRSIRRSPGSTRFVGSFRKAPTASYTRRAETRPRTADWTYRRLLER